MVETDVGHLVAHVLCKASRLRGDISDRVSGKDTWSMNNGRYGVGLSEKPLVRFMVPYPKPRHGITLINPKSTVSKRYPKRPYMFLVVDAFKME